jgi:hypothetical protein
MLLILVVVSVVVSGIPIFAMGESAQVVEGGEQVMVEERSLYNVSDRSGGKGGKSGNYLRLVPVILKLP